MISSQPKDHPGYAIGDTSAGPLITKDHRLPAVILEVGLGSIPLVASLLMIVSGIFNFQAASALIFLLFLSSVGVLVARVRRGITIGSMASLTFVAGFVFWYSYPAFISHFLPDYEVDETVYLFVDPETIIWSVAYLSLFLLSGIIMSLLFQPSPLRQRRRHNRNATNERSIIAFSLGGCFFGLLTYFVLGGGKISTIIAGILESRAIEKPWLHTENLGNVISAFTYVTSSAMVSGACLLWSATIDKSMGRMSRTFVWIVAFVITVIIYFDHGTRSIFALILLPYLSMWLLVLGRRSNLYWFIVFPLVLMVIIVLLQFQMLYRADFTRSEIYNLLFQEWFTLGNTIDYFKETLFAVQLIPADHDYFRESVLLQFLVSPIPRFLWPDKPATELVWFYTLSRWNIDIYAQGGNTLPGIVGQYYMSWGWIGPVIIGALLGWLTGRLDAFLSKLEIDDDPYTCAVGIMLIVWIFVSYRLLSPGFLYPVMGSALIVFLSRRRDRSSALADMKRRAEARPFAAP